MKKRSFKQLIDAVGDLPSGQLATAGLRRKRKHRNTSRLTARERAKAFGESYYPFFSEAEVRAWTRLLEAHAAATLARHRRKVRAGW